MSSPIRLSECADCFESPDCEQTVICRFIGAFATVIYPHKNFSFEAVKFYLNTKRRYSDFQRCIILEYLDADDWADNADLDQTVLRRSLIGLCSVCLYATSQLILFK